MRITVIIPTYNEAENLSQLVPALFALPLDLNVLVVDDNSPDGTGQIADGLVGKYPSKVKVIHRAGKSGLSSAYLQAIQSLFASDVEAIAQMDADFSHDPGKLPDMVKKLETCDLVLGSRYIPGGSTDNNWPIWRKALSAWGNFYARTILGLPVRDVTGGFRLWRIGTLLRMPLNRVRSTGYIFLVEMLYLASCLGFKIGEVPIYFADRRWGKSKMSLNIQVEAAFQVWRVLWDYHDLRRMGIKARNKMD